MKFQYKIQTKDNTIVEGIADASDKFSLARELREKGNIPIAISEIKAKAGVFAISFDWFESVSLAEKIVFTNNLSGMLNAGLSLTRALQVLEKQSTNKMLTDILHSLAEDINKGNTLSDGMKKYPKVFSSIFVSMVKAGEESGGLPKALQEVGVNLKKSFELRKKIKSALTYPTIIICAILLIGVLMMIYVVPTLAQTFKELNTQLPVSTRAIIWLSDAISGHIILFTLSVGVLVTAIILFAKLDATKKSFDYITLRLPVIGTLLKEMNSAQTARTLSSLLSSGVDMSRSLSITENVLQNIYYKAVIHDAIVAIEKGDSLSNSFKNNTHLYPIMVGEMMEVGEETGNLSAMLLDIANFYEGEVDAKTKDLSTIIEPILMVFIGGAVGFFAISMISPIYSVMDNIK